MRNIFIQLAIAFFILFPDFATSAPDNTQAKIDYEVFKAKTETNIEALKSLKSQELIQFQAQIDNQNNSIEQINHQTDSFGNYLTIGSTIVTVLLLLIGFFSYRNAQTDAQSIAKQEALKITQQEVKTWFDKNTSNLSDEIELLRKKLKALEEEVTKAALNAKEQMNKHLNDALSRPISETDNKSQLITDEEQKALAAKVEELRTIAEAMYKFNDWNTKAYAAYQQGDFVNATKFWEYASKSSDATDEQSAQSMFNLGFTQRKALKQTEAGIATYDALIEKFGNSSHPNVQEQVARAYINKGFSQSDALKQHQAAIATYDALIEKFGNSSHPNVQEQVGCALNGKGFNLLLEAKQQWDDVELRKTGLKQALIFFNTATDKIATNDKAIILGNIAYTQHLLDQHENVVNQLKEALTLGGEALYKATLADTEQYTVPEDATFKDLTEQAWAEIKPRKDGENA